MIPIKKVSIYTFNFAVNILPFKLHTYVYNIVTFMFCLFIYLLCYTIIGHAEKQKKKTHTRIKLITCNIHFYLQKHS